ncbi:MAG: universal stress protein [Myxococcota bacterium]
MFTFQDMERIAQHILVPIDFSEASDLALRAAALLAQQNGASLVLCHVLDPQPLGPRGTRGEPGTEQVFTEAGVEKKIHEELQRRAEHVLDGVEMRTAVILSPNAAAGICDYAEKEGVDLIVLSTHGRTGLSHMLIGSVAERVVRHAPCPVLTLRSKTK